MNANTPIRCGLAALGRLRVPVEALPELRRNPGPIPDSTLSASFLKHSDEQTVLGLTAVFHALHDSGLSLSTFHDWGVLAAPRFLGRGTVSFHVSRFIAEGAWGVSPHVIPHRSLHALSGTVSQALRMHGPNFGVGGGPGSPVEAFLNAAALLHGQGLPGLWVVLTEMQPDVAPQPTGQLLPGTVGLALALALVTERWEASARLPQLHLHLKPERTGLLSLEQVMPLFDLAPGQTSQLTLDQGGWLEVHWPSPSSTSPLRCERPSGGIVGVPSHESPRGGTVPPHTPPALSPSSLPVETER